MNHVYSAAAVCLFVLQQILFAFPHFQSECCKIAVVLQDTLLFWPQIHALICAVWTFACVDVSS